MSSRTASAATPEHRRAVVIGGGLAGMLAAAAIAPYADEVTVVERDTLPATAEPRRYLPQSGHAHMMWSGGVEAMEQLLPGVSGRLLAAGARRIPLTHGMVALSAQGWYRRWRPTHYVFACTRELLDWVVREQVLALPAVKTLTRAKVTGLAGGARRITGVRLRTDDGEERVLDASLVVDASGRGTDTPKWLRALGLAEVPQEEVDSGVVYASRLYQAPPGTEEFPVVSVQAVARDPRPGRTATLMPVEDGRWLVTLSGTRGGQPSRDAAEFEEFARTARHPVVAELLAHATPLTEVSTFGNTANRRRFFEKARHWPEGLVVVGDAVASYNPVYGHGMSVAAQCARLLRAELTAAGLAGAGLARRVQKAVAGPVTVAWSLATGQDIFYPDTTGRPPRAADRLLARYVDRLMLTATGDFLVATALTDVMTLSAPITALVRPRVVWHALLGPRLPQLPGPPLTARERTFMDRTDA